MAPVVHASTPARASNAAGTTVTTGTFNPPATSLLLAFFEQDLGPNITANVSMSNNGSATTWQSVGQIGDAETNQTTAALQINVFFTTLASSRTGMTVTATTDQSNELGMKVYVLTGHDPADPIGNYLEGFDVAASSTTDNFTPVSLDNLVFGHFGDDAATVTPTIDGTSEPFRIAGTIAGGSSYKTATNPTTFTASATSSRLWAWQVFDVNTDAVVHVGAVSLSVGKTLTVNGTHIPVHQGAVNLSSSPTLTVGGTVSPTHVGAVNLQVGKTLTAQAGQSGQVSMSVGKTLSTNGQITLLQVAVSMSVTKTLTAGNPIQTMFALVQMDVTPTLTMDGVRSRSSKLFTRFPRPAFEHPFRLIAQEILTGEIVDWDLPVQNDFEFTRQLSGPTVMTGSFKPEIISVQELGLDGYAYWFHVEINEEIRASGIFMPPTYEDQGLSFTCEGHSSIPHYTTWTSSLSAIGIDVFTIVRNIWNHVQSDPRGNFGVQVATQLSGRTLGTPATSETTPPVPPETEPTVRQIDAEPYELQWWEAPNCGDQIDTLAQQTPFDYRERVAWNSTKTDVVRYLDLGYPRLGTTRTNLEFNEENILEIVPVQEDEGSYASEVIVIGAGEGSATIRGYAAEHFANRIKRSHVITDKTITTKVRADDVAKAELGIRRGRLFEISEIVVRPYHTNAMIGEYDVGDDIYIVVDIPWMNIPYGAWYRITSITINPANDIVRITVEPSASFRYPPAVTAP